MVKKVIIVGAGLCGLTAAYRLSQAGMDVTVLEKSDYSGGRTLTVEDNGYKVDQGASLMPSSYKELLELAEEIGLGDEVIPVPSTSATYIDGQFYPLRMDKPVIDFLKSPYLTMTDKASFIRLLPVMTKYWKNLGFADLSGAAASDTQTAKEFCQKYLTNTAYERLINPLLRGTYIANGDSVSATQLLWIFKNFSGISVFGFKNGMQSLANALAQKVNVEYGVSIDRVDESDNGVLVTGQQEGNAVDYSADTCLIATDGKDLQKIYGHSLTGNQNEFLSDLVYAPIKMITYMISKRPNTEALLMMPTEKDDPDLGLIVMDHLYGESRCPAGMSMISFLAMSGLQEAWVDDTEHEQLIEFGKVRLNKYFPELVDSVVKVNTRYWPRASTVGVPDNYKKLKRFVDDIDVNSKVYFSGDYMVASSVGVAVATGNAVAKNMLLKK